jgi:FkbM family methyltransferase
MKKRVSMWWRAYERKKRIARDARIIGSMPWAEYFNGWFDDVTAFSAEPNGGIFLRRLGVTIPRETALWLLGRNWSYGNCVQLAERGVTFQMEASGLVADFQGGRFLLQDWVSVHILHELVVQHSYYWAPLGTPLLIFDIGMNIGFSALMLAIREPSALVIGFEPFRSTFDVMQRNLALNPGLASRITAYQYGLSDRDAQEEWTLSVDDASISGQFLEKGPGDQESTPVTLRAASAVMGPLREAHPHRGCMVKMDCEGGEYAILKDWAGSGFLKHIDLLAMEYHEIGGHRLEELESCLIRNGFTAIVQPAKSTGKPSPFGFIYAFPRRGAGG